MGCNEDYLLDRFSGEPFSRKTQIKEETIRFFKKIQLANNPFCQTLTWVVLAAFLFSTACTTTRVISRPIDPQPDTLQNALNKGDLVNVTTKGGNSFKLRIDDLSSEAIIGSEKIQEVRYIYMKQHRVLFTDIAKIEKLTEKKETSGGKTLALLVIVVGLPLWGLIVLASIVAEAKES